MKKPISFTDAEIEQIRNEPKPDTGPLSTHFKLDEQAGCKITEIKEQGTEEGAKLNWLMSFIEHDLDMQKI